MKIYIDAMSGTYGMAGDIRIVDLEKIDSRDQWDILDDLDGYTDNQIADFGTWYGEPLEDHERY